MARQEAIKSLKEETSRKMIQVAYILGVALVLAAIIYFFTANWPAFGRGAKLGLSLGLMLGFYLLSFVFARLWSQHTYLSRILLFAGVVAFGISVILIGEIYNSHTDQYVLFLIWGLVALAMAYLSREESIYSLAFVLVNLTLWFFFYPAGGLWVYSAEKVLVTMFVFLLANGLIFYLSHTRFIQIWTVHLLAFLASQGVMLYFSMKAVNEKYWLISNASYLLVLGLTLYYLSKYYENTNDKRRHFLIRLSYVSGAIYLLLKYFEYITEHFKTSSFVISLVLALLALLANVFYAKYKKKKLDINKGRSKGEAGGSEKEVISGAVEEIWLKNEKDLSGKETILDEKNQIWSYVSTVLVTIVIATIASVSLIFLITETMGDFYDLRIFFLFLSIFAFILPAILIRNINILISYTLISIGYLILSITIFSLENYYLLLWLPLMVLGFYFLANNILRVLLYIPLHLVLLIKVYELLERFDLTVILLIMMNLLLIFISRAYFKREKSEETSDPAVRLESPKGLNLDGDFWQSVYKNSFFYVVGLLFILSFYDGSLFGLNAKKVLLAIPIHYIYNLIFFGITTYLIFWSQREKRSYEYKLAMSFWFIYLVYKYYDLVWSLLHKSLALIVLGLIFLGLAFVYERRLIDRKANEDLSLDSESLAIDREESTGHINREDVGEGNPERQREQAQKGIVPNIFLGLGHEIWGRTLGLALTLLLVQVGILGFQIVTSELALARGQDVILQLESTGLYSIEQGSYSYLNFNYEISRLEDEFKDRSDEEWEVYWENRWDKDLIVGQRMELVLRADADGIYRYNRMYQGEVLAADEVMMVGRYAGWRINFGIESFPYSRDRADLERLARYAEVRVSDRGDAILLDILARPDQ